MEPLQNVYENAKIVHVISNEVINTTEITPSDKLYYFNISNSSPPPTTACQPETSNGNNNENENEQIVQNFTTPTSDLVTLLRSWSQEDLVDHLIGNKINKLLK